MFSAEDWVIVDDAWIWIVVVSFVIAFILAFGIGANDVANSFGSSVGAKVLTLRQACILGTIFEILGAVLIGSKVSDTIRKGIISVDLFPNGTEKEFMVGNMAALSGSCVWMLVATFLKLPVSTTHSIVGATIGFSLVANGVKGVNWRQLGLIVGSWFASPILSGTVSTALFFLVYKIVLTKEKPLEPGLKLLPVFYAFTIAINFFSVFYKGSQLMKFDEIPLYGTFILSFGSAIIVAIIVRFIVVPWQRKKITEHAKEVYRQRAEEGGVDTDKSQEKYTPSLSVDNIREKIGNQTYSVKYDSAADKDSPIDFTNSKESLGAKSDVFLIPVKENGVHMTADSKNVCSKDLHSGKENSSVDKEDKIEVARRNIQDTPETQSLFSFLQVLTAIFGSFAHGGNDVSNAIGPLVAIWITATTGSAAQKAPVPIWILLLGGIGISLGLWILGRRVMETIGKNLTKITPTSGFCIEIGSALTVLLASNIGIPVSTTHCKVGSIVFVGWFRSRAGVDWKLFRNILIAWFVTLPIAGGISAAVMAGLREVI